jgi:prepilin-type processing-associated H-X9-DG protein
MVVVAIICILAAIMLPILFHAKLRAYTSTCQNNLHHLIIAANLYADDWDCYLPPVDSANGGPGANPQGLTADIDPRSLYNLLRRHVKNAKVFKCFVCPWAWPWDPEHGQYGVINYQYHPSAVVAYDTTTHRYSQAKRRELVIYPSRSILIMDVFYLLYEGYPLHQDGMNYAYVDAHVAWKSKNVYGPGRPDPEFYYPGVRENGIQ